MKQVYPITLEYLCWVTGLSPEVARMLRVSHKAAPAMVALGVQASKAGEAFKKFGSSFNKIKWPRG